MASKFHVSGFPFDLSSSGRQTIWLFAISKRKRPVQSGTAVDIFIVLPIPFAKEGGGVISKILHMPVIDLHLPGFRNRVTATWNTRAPICGIGIAFFLLFAIG